MSIPSMHNSIPPKLSLPELTPLKNRAQTISNSTLGFLKDHKVSILTGLGTAALLGATVALFFGASHFIALGGGMAAALGGTSNIALAGGALCGGAAIASGITTIGGLAYTVFKRREEEEKKQHFSSI